MTDTTEFKAKAIAHANIAVAKYWGKRDAELNLPFVDSVAFNVEGLTTETTAIWNEDDFRDGLVINGWEVPSQSMGRIQRILDAIRARTGLPRRCMLHSTSNFQVSTGLASSASGCAAAALAASKAAGLDLTEHELSALARLGSGSAARSIPSGWTRWCAGTLEDGSDSYAVSIAPPDHWPLHVFVVRVSDEPKKVSSTDAMIRCQDSPFWQTYLSESKSAADIAQNAILHRDFAAFADALHHNTMLLHALAMTCRPPILYFLPKSLELIRHILRASQAMQVCCTLDAGANVVILCEDVCWPFVKNDVIALGLPYTQTRVGHGVSLL